MRQKTFKCNGMPRLTVRAWIHRPRQHRQRPWGEAAVASNADLLCTATSATGHGARANVVTSTVLTLAYFVADVNCMFCWFPKLNVLEY